VCTIAPGGVLRIHQPNTATSALIDLKDTRCIGP
jgi:hypothetical protein